MTSSISFKMLCIHKDISVFLRQLFVVKSKKCLIYETVDTLGNYF